MAASAAKSSFTKFHRILPGVLCSQWPVAKGVWGPDPLDLLSLPLNLDSRIHMNKEFLTVRKVKGDSLFPKKIRNYHFMT